MQLGVGYTVAYLVYTIGTLVTAPASLNIPAALAGLAAVVVFIAVLALLIHHSGQKVQQEYALDSSGAKGYVVGG